MVTGVKCRRRSTLVEKVSKIPTLSQGIATSQSKALLSSISCGGLGKNASLADAVHYSLVWKETRCLKNAER